MLNYSKIILSLRAIPLITGTKCYSKQSRILTKLISKGVSKKRRQWHDFQPTYGEAFLPSPTSISSGPQSNRRVAVLNKLFMKHVTDLLASGKCACLVVGKGIEVTKVKVGAEYNIVNIYWTSSGEDTEEILAQILRRVAGELREELTGLHIMGQVPFIQFVKDRSVSSWATVENILKTADMGEDHEPKGLSMHKRDFGNESVLPPDFSNNAKTEEISIEALPPMRHNVLGLDRACILERILSNGKSQMKRTKTSEHMLPKYEPFDEAVFAQFLQARKIAREKAAKYGGSDVRNYETDTNLQDDGDDDDPNAMSDDDYMDDEYYSDDEVDR